MEGNYIDELIEKLHDTQIWKGNEEKCKDYDEGIAFLVGRFAEHKENGSYVFFIGNGGSAAIASHMTADFMKNGGMNTLSLYDNAVLTCMGNDYGYEHVFSKPLELLGRRGDLLVAVSSSGNSPNIIKAICAAKNKGMEVITFTGFQQDNRAKQLGMANVYVPSGKYGMVESIHNLVLQQIVDVIMEKDGKDVEGETSSIS